MISKQSRDILNELKGKLPIDQYNLEVECRNQPALLEEVGELAAEVKRDSRVAKDHLDYVKADLSAKIRSAPAKYALTKVTADILNSTIILQPEYREATQSMIDAMEYADVFSTFLVAVEQRKSLVRDMVSLYLHQYYSSQNLSKEENSLGQATEEEILKKRETNNKEDQQEEGEV